MANLSRLRELSKKYRRWQNLDNWIDRIELVYESDLESAISNSNSLIETILKTILAERVAQYKNDEKLLKDIKLTALVTQTLKNIKLVKSDENIRFINGMIAAIQNLGEIRNGFSHGKNLATYKDSSPEKFTASFLIASVENISCFLIEFYEIEYPLKGKQEQNSYENFEDFNNWLDDEYGTVIVADIPISTSLALFADLIAYQEKYKNYLSVKDDEII
ncbi:hypothetical protein A6769_33310 [Nostoc punctiforme NIES-2108]|uniref:Uncharacterized protein n=1 Tax=Nostoc punctiforme NIES-2108 TaxID=1356359 RepID=A0A367R255_NOSPU|nr:hypothetical protein A6769_33310 [Nostoc punctiforme NIES-2108]